MHLKTIRFNSLAVGLAALLSLGALLMASPGHGAQSAYQSSGEKDYPSSEAEYAARLAAAHGGTNVTWEKLPDWNGVYIRDHGGRIPYFDESAPGSEIPGYPVLTASLTPKYLAAYQKKFANIKAGIEWDRLSWCLPAGFPRWLAEPWSREFIVTPKQVWLTHEQVNETRRIYTDGRGHVSGDLALPQWLGDSIGFWDGDTLVVHTNHLKAGEYARGNPDFSFKTSTVERIRRTAPGVIEDRITVYDPDSLVKPFRAIFRYKKMPADVRVNYASCEENNNTYRMDDGRSGEYLPGDKEFRDATTFGIPEVALDSLPK
jgi:hypothetical protein